MYFENQVCRPWTRPKVNVNKSMEKMPDFTAVAAKRKDLFSRVVGEF